MYIPQNCCKTQGLRKAYINSLTNDRHYSIKQIRNIDKNLARTYTNAKYYGGSLKSFWNKVKKFGKRVISSAVNTTRQMYKPAKWIINKLANSKTAESVINGIGNAVGSAVGVPGLGAIINTGLKSADTITDSIENIIKNIMDKNPSLTIQEIKNLINKVKTTTENVVNSTNISQEEKDKVKENVNKIYNKLPDVIKSEGIKKVDEAAGYLPVVDFSSLTEKELKGKGGAIRREYRVIKPILIAKHKELFNGLPAYKAASVGSVAGAIMKPKIASKPKEKDGCSGRVGLAGGNGGRVGLSGGRVGLAGEDKTSKTNNSDLINKLRAKLNK
jgi:hypothetical protein